MRESNWVILLVTAAAGCSGSDGRDTGVEHSGVQDGGATDDTSVIEDTSDTEDAPGAGTITLTNSTGTAIYEAMTCRLDADEPCESHFALQGTEIVALIQPRAAWSTEVEAGAWWAVAVTEALACEGSEELVVPDSGEATWNVAGFGGVWNQGSRTCDDRREPGGE